MTRTLVSLELENTAVMGDADTTNHKHQSEEKKMKTEDDLGGLIGLIVSPAITSVRRHLPLLIQYCTILLYCTLYTYTYQ